MSLPPSNVGKALSSPPPPPSTHSPIASTAASTVGSDFFSSRRPGQQTGASAAGTSATPRKGQAARKQHRNQKRPGASGAGNNSSGGGFGNKGYRFDDEDDMAEFRALKNASSRRGQTSITHLLNYAAPSRAHLEHAFGGNDHYYGSRSQGRGHHGGGHGHSHHGYRSHHHNSAVDKARFVHANYRFVVTPKGNYAAQAVDADEYIDWNDVLQILASAESQNSSCPICLSEPVAPRMAKCGHIFCLPCLIRFMHAIDTDESSAASRNTVRTIAGLTSPNANGGAANHHHHNNNNNSHNQSSNTPPAPVPEKRAKWKKCPICEESVYLGEVRPVRFYAGQESPLPRPGDDVVLRLMLRHANSTVALPRDGSADLLNGKKTGIPWHFAANVLDYSRIMKGTGDYMVEEFGRELEDLARQEKEDELLFHEDGEWTRRAMRQIRTAQENARELGGLELALQDGSIFGDNNSQRQVKLPVGAAPASDEASGNTPKRMAASSSTSSSSASAANTAAAAAQQQDFYFYMSPPHLYLSPLDIRILKTKYGSFSNFPSTLLPRVEHLSTGHVVDDAMRRRAKYLGHLPAGCVVSFLECDWTDIVPAETLATFAEDIERRRKRNRDKAAQEERERLQAERLERRRTTGGAGGGGSGQHGDSNDDFYGDTDTRPMDINEFQPLGSVNTSADGGILSSSASPPNPRVGFEHLASISTTPPSSSPVTAAGGGAGGSASQRTVWGTRAVPASPSLQAYNLAHASSADDGWLRDDEVLGSLLDNNGGQLAMNDAELAAQLSALGVENAEPLGNDDKAGAAASSTSASASAKSLKKKKKQKITLMSTGGRRGN
ncbi:hypothetical protein SCUCBS95973_001063 [Sporothrix curviconia]|uniref:RING-type domain-containing protein n=1 Tax=Sporothrix curviconia TaxID=1260050 RepID=A0ABP0AVN4_9PEZI